MKQIPTIDKNPKGLHQRYIIRKIVGVVPDEKHFGHELRYKTKAVDKGSEYFVMRLDLGGKDKNHIAACRKAIQTYADAIEATIPQLARDLRERYPLLNP